MQSFPYIGGEVGVGSSGGAEVGVGSMGRGVSVGGGEVGGEVGGAGVEVGWLVGAGVVGLGGGTESDRRVGVFVAVASEGGNMITGVRIPATGVRDAGMSVCVTTKVISGVSDKAAADILLLNRLRLVVSNGQRPGPVSPSLYAWMAFARLIARCCSYCVISLPESVFFNQSLASIICSTTCD